MRRRALLVLGCAALVGCGPKRVAPPPSAPAVTTAADLLPADLDVVVRLDLGKVKAALGEVALRALSREVLSRSDVSDPDDLVLPSLLAADVVYLAYRPGPLLQPLDRVLALQGSFEALSRPPAGFAPAVDLGRDVRYFERRELGGLARGSSARLYVASTRVRAFVSAAEIDAVERVLETGGAERRLAAPEEGTLSLAARPRLLARFGGAELREQLESAKSLRGVVDLASDGVKVTLELDLLDAADAELLGRALTRVLARAGGSWAERGEVRAVAGRLVVSARLSRGELLPLLGCVQRGSDSECPW